MNLRRHTTLTRREPKVIGDGYTIRPRTPAPALGLVSSLPLGQVTTRVMPKRASPTAAEREHMGRVAALGCLLCGSPAEVHHIREEQGMSQRASNWLTTPLCSEHHRGASGFHGLGMRAFERRYGLSELDLLAMTIERLAA